MSNIESKTPVSAGEVEKSHTYDGSGTEDDPFVVEFQKDDPSNPMNWGQFRKWFIAAIATSSVFAVTFTSSAYSVSANEVFQDFDISTEVFIVGLSLFVLGFAIGPAVWGPLRLIANIDSRSELYGRRILWIITHIAMVAFLGGSAGSQNVATLLILRLFAGTFGGSPLVNSGGTIADIFPPAQRGLALTIYCVAPFLGPILGPIVGGFVSENIGWRWVQGVCVIFIGIIGILGIAFIPETYGPVLLQQRARQLAKADGKVYVSILEKNQGKKKPSEVFKRALFRPWIFLFLEPIVLVASLYMAIIYGTVYMFMGAMPIVYNEDRGWSEGIGGLSFMGIAVGIIFGLIYAIWDNNSRYMKLFAAKSATAESRLPPAIVGGIALPIGMFAFAWTNYPSIHWSVSIILSAPFGFGCVLVILPIMNYLIDTYTIYAASVLAAAAIFRSLVGAVFPLFTTQMYHNLGIHWASSIPAFMTLACMPFPLIMYRYGAAVRMKCKYSFEAAEMMRKMQMQQTTATAEKDKDSASE
ncbi:Major facilitator superfamily domain, general substrate transporter [Penicillium griseofulvum]|uniref:Major facilitator superfamily domain, general substrate transporter n=1 Tax=Penicillium patulum TaxID=5078 RepID=A0A135LF45_PENPA|nr:Major facilitator superfamily domain, general substrate transporter [Penicillium griseofulvum]KXG47594.1 Major facilitator superfamily domain, general substrate transporter [Penicillium griseofulvum]